MPSFVSVFRSLVPASRTQWAMAIGQLAAILAALASLLDTSGVAGASAAKTTTLGGLAAGLASVVSGAASGNDVSGSGGGGSPPIIAVMGETGVGKSTMIRALGATNATGHLPHVGHGLEPCTRGIGWYGASVDGLPYYILDTPGFDDSVLSDSEILHMLIDELAAIYREERKLAGVVYIHDISRVRVGGTSYRNMLLFQKLVGDQSMDNIILATTHWDGASTNPQLAQREDELKRTFWKRMVEHGSRVERLEATVESAKQLVRSLVKKSTKGVVLQVVEEIVKQGLRYDQTEAGKSVNQELERFKVAMAKEMAELNRDLKEVKAGREKQIGELQQRHNTLLEDLKRVAEEERAELRKQIEKLGKNLETDRLKAKEEVEELKKEKERVEQKLANAKGQAKEWHKKPKSSDPTKPKPNPGSFTPEQGSPWPSFQYRGKPWADKALRWLWWFLTVMETILFLMVEFTSMLNGEAFMVVIMLLQPVAWAVFSLSLFNSCEPETQGIVCLGIIIIQKVIMEVRGRENGSTATFAGFYVLFLPLVWRYFWRRCGV